MCVFVHVHFGGEKLCNLSSVTTPQTEEKHLGKGENHHRAGPAVGRNQAPNIQPQIMFFNDRILPVKE